MSVDDLFTDAPEAFAIRSARLTLRLPQRHDRAARIMARTLDYADLRPLEPMWAPDHLTYAGGEAWERHAREQYIEKRSLSLFIYENDGGAVVGSCEATRLSDAPLSTGMVGYWVLSNRRGRGYMPEALQALCHYLHKVGELQRIEAGCLLSNTKSHRVLEKCGFQREGVSRSFAEIGGQRQDHLMFARLDGEAYAPADATFETHAG